MFFIYQPMALFKPVRRFLPARLKSGEAALLILDKRGVSDYNVINSGHGPVLRALYTVIIT